MTPKEKALEVIKGYIRAGVLTESDIRLLFAEQLPKDNKSDHDDKTSAVDVMFYVAGIIFFAAIMSLIGQSWDTGEGMLHIMLSAGTGGILWLVAYALLKRQPLSDIRNGLVNALLVTGALLVVIGGYIIANEIVNGYDEVNFIPAAIAFAVVGAIHIGFDRIIQRKLILAMGILVSVLAFPAFIFGLLKDANAPADVWAIVVLLSAVLLVCAARVVAKIYKNRQGIARSFDSSAAFIALTTMYITSYVGSEGLWLVVLIATVLGVFYACIIFQSKNLLGIASFFLIITVITISFRYFSQYGVSVSLIIATVGLLGSAAVASSINKKYLNS